MHKRTVLLAIAALAARPALALYDPPPNTLLAPSLGSWRGALTYRDYQNPERMVTLQTTLTITFNGPEDLALFYVFDDGPGKIVYAYERMAFDFARRELAWRSGTNTADSRTHRITSVDATAGAAKVVFERSVEGGTDLHALVIKPRHWQLDKRELRAGKDDLVRSTYAFTRGSA